MGAFLAALAPVLLNAAGSLLSKKSNNKAGERALAGDMDTIEKLMNLSNKYNRTDDRGILSGWNWNEDKTAQEQYINPAMQPGVDAFMGRVGQGSANPQLDELMQARFASMMNRPTETRPRPEMAARPPNRSQRNPDEGPPPDWWRRDRVGP